MAPYAYRAITADNATTVTTISGTVSGSQITGATLATTTLPASPAVGDVVKVSSPSAGGWTLSPNAGQTIEGGSVTVVVPGLSWTARESVRVWNAVASSADGAKLVATVANGQIYTSVMTRTTITGVQSSAAELVYVGSGKWFVVSQQGALTSP